MKKRKIFKQMTAKEAVEACVDNRLLYEKGLTPAVLPSHPVTERGKRRKARRESKKS